MKKVLGTILLACILGLGGSQASAVEEIPPEPANPVDQFTGKYWVNTIEGNKKAYLFGIESAIAVEYFISKQSASKTGRGAKKQAYTLSPFEKGWMAAFKDTTRDQIMQEIDKWYAEHPDQLDRPVLSVIWNDLIEPRLDAAK